MYTKSESKHVREVERKKHNDNMNFLCLGLEFCKSFLDYANFIENP